MPTVDIALVGSFLLGLVLVGLWPSRIRGREAFLISDRKLGGVATGFTIAASKIGGGLIVTYSTLVFVFGYHALWLFAGYIIGYTLFYFFARSLQQEAHANGYYTMADFFQTRFGKPAGVAIGLGCAISLTGWIFTNLIAGGELIGAITHLSPPEATLLMAVPMAIYLVIGGFHSVVKTDILQYIAMMVILVVITVAMGNLDAPKIATTTTKPMAAGHVLSFILFGTLFPMGSAELWQRAYAARDRKGLFFGISVASVTFLVLGLALSFICLQLRKITLSDDSVAAQLGLAKGVAQALGPVLAGLWIIAFLSAIISSADTFVFTTASALVEDVFERAGILRREQRIPAMRVAILLLCGVGVVGAAAFKSVVTVAFFYAGVTMSLGVVALLARFTRRLGGTGIAAALLAGLVASTYEAFTYGVTPRTASVNASVTLLVALAALPFPPQTAASQTEDGNGR